MDPIGLVMVAAGLFAVSGALFNWEWFMNSRKARFLSAIITRTGARIFYAAIGLFLLIIGVMTAFGIGQ